MAEQSEVSYIPAQLIAGLNLDNSLPTLKAGMWTYALNAVIESWDNSYALQNEQGNTLCSLLPAGYKVIGVLSIIEDGEIMLWLANPSTGGSEIGFIKDCVYTKWANSSCLNFSTQHPILKAFYKKTNCSTEVYWTDAYNNRRWMDRNKVPYKEIEDPNGCGNIILPEIDCNKLLIQPNFKIPQIGVAGISNDGDVIAGVYQFAAQYANALGEGYTGYYSVTNPVPIFDPIRVTMDFNYPVNKSIHLNISNIDTTGYYDYINIAVIKTVNNITSVELLGTYQITESSISLVYNGQSKDSERLTITDIFEKFPVYDVADDLFTVNDILGWKGLTTPEKVNYQSVANKIPISWQTWRLKYDENNKDPLIYGTLRGYMRDEVYPLEFVPLLKNGWQPDGAHIPGRISSVGDQEVVLNDDALSFTKEACTPIQEPKPRWGVYNTGCVLGYEKEYQDFTSSTPQDPRCYVGPYQYGCMAYWESVEKYPCNKDVWGELADMPIRHHKFPDNILSHIHDDDGYVYPIGIKVDIEQVKQAIANSDLTQEQKDNIIGFKIVRGNRVNNKSVVAKGLFTNVLKYSDNDQGIPVLTVQEGEQSTDLLDSSIDLVSEANSHYPVPTTFPVPTSYLVSKANFQFALDKLDVAKQSAPGEPLHNGPLYYQSLKDADERLSLILPANYPEWRNVKTARNYISILLRQYETQNPGSVPVSLPSVETTDGLTFFPNYLYNDVRTPGGEDAFLRHIQADDDSKYRWCFHSPDTSFYQPSLGNIIKLDTIEYGLSRGRFREVKKHSKYQFVNENAYISSIVLGLLIGALSGTYGLSTQVFDGAAAFTTYRVMLDIVYKVTPRRNPVFQYNSIGDYSEFVPIPNEGKKQRLLDIAAYITPGMVNIGDVLNINNYQRESSVYLKASKPLPFIHENYPLLEDKSKFVVEDYNIRTAPISSYYGAIKNHIPNQWGQIYSYETIDTGAQYIFKGVDDPVISVFGGDVFINKFGYKSKMPFFLDNRVNFPDDADVFYNELSNVGQAKYWFSTDATKGSTFGSIFGIKPHSFYKNENKFFNDYGNMALFAYGIPYFFCESEVNVDARQAFNGTNGEFYPHVSSGIPEDWFQEINTPIAEDNTYFYNKTFSKQNKENLFTHIPNDFTSEECKKNLPFRAIFSEEQNDLTFYHRNNWLVYRPSAYFDFPQTYGALTSLDGVENRQVVARFENKSLLYNALLTAPTSAQDVYLGQSLFSKNTPPLDFADTDLGYLGSQNKFFLKTEYGYVTGDAKRGSIFLLNPGSKAGVSEITSEGMRGFFVEFLNFQIKKAFPDVNVDNHFNGCGLHGVYDSKYKRLIITKIDYKPLVDGITHYNGVFYYNNKEIQLSDPNYFCNYSFTISYGFNVKAWVSFHSYIPNFYIGDVNTFYTGLNDGNGVWLHNKSIDLFNNFYGKLEPYEIEYPIAYKTKDEILQSVKDYSQILEYTDFREFTETDDIYFNKAVLYNNQQTTGVLELVKKPVGNLKLYREYPKYKAESKEILFAKSDNFYQWNTMWDLSISPRKPMWVKSCKNLSVYKEVNQENCSYSKRSYRKAPLRAKDLKIRLINDIYDRYRFISLFLLQESQISYK